METYLDDFAKWEGEDDEVRERKEFIERIMAEVITLSSGDPFDYLYRLMGLIGRGLQFTGLAAEANPSEVARWQEKQFVYAFLMSANDNLDKAMRGLIHAGYTDSPMIELRVAIVVVQYAMRTIRDGADTPEYVPSLAQEDDKNAVQLLKIVTTLRNLIDLATTFNEHQVALDDTISYLAQQMDNTRTM